MTFLEGEFVRGTGQRLAPTHQEASVPPHVTSLSTCVNPISFQKIYLKKNPMLYQAIETIFIVSQLISKISVAPYVTPLSTCVNPISFQKYIPRKKLKVVSNYFHSFSTHCVNLISFQKYISRKTKKIVSSYSKLFS